MVRDTSMEEAPVFQAVDQFRLYVLVAKQIAEHIERVPLLPGAQLPVERELARQFAVSRTTVREAMIALETIGLVEVKGGSGTYVSAALRLNSKAPWDTGRDPGPGPHEQFRVRSLLECAAVADAAANITGEELDELGRLIDAMAESLDGPSAEADRFAFHDIVAKASRNSIMVRLIRELWEMRSGDMWRKIRDRAVQPQHHVEAFQDRCAIYEALRRGDAEQARAAMQSLMDRIQKRYFEHVDD